MACAPLLTRFSLPPARTSANPGSSPLASREQWRCAAPSSTSAPGSPPPAPSRAFRRSSRHSCRPCRISSASRLRALAARRRRWACGSTRARGTSATSPTALRTSSSTWPSRAPPSARSCSSRRRLRIWVGTSTRTHPASRPCTTQRCSRRTCRRRSSCSPTSSPTRPSRRCARRDDSARERCSPGVWVAVGLARRVCRVYRALGAPAPDACN